MCLVRHLADRCQSRAAMGRTSHDPVQSLTAQYRKRGGNVQLRRPGRFACGCDRTAASASSAQSKLRSDQGIDCMVYVGNATMGASYQSSLVRGKMSTLCRPVQRRTCRRT